MYAHIFKAWTKAAWVASALARSKASRQNAANAASLQAKIHELHASNAPNKPEAVNAHMVSLGYLHHGTDNKKRHIFVPIPLSDKATQAPANPILGHKVSVTYDAHNRAVDSHG